MSATNTEETTILDASTAPRPGLLFKHAFITTGYQDADGPEAAIFEVTEVTEDGKVFYGPAQRGIATKATLYIPLHLFARDALGEWVGDRGVTS